MKDGTPETQHNKLPPCSFSVHCERLLEDLDTNSASIQDASFLFADNAQDRQLLLQLQAHLPGCPTCTFLLSHARIRRFQQRQHLQRFLLESEQKVPSTTAQIMQAITREWKKVPEERVVSNGHNHIVEEAEKIPLIMPLGRKRPARRSRKLMQNLLAFAAVLAIILASFSLFSHLLLLHQPSSHEMSSSPAIRHTAISVTHSTAWSSVIIALIQGGQENITSIDPMTGKSVVLASSDYPDTTVLDGVSHDGYQVLYHVFDGHMTRYYLQPSAQNPILYTVAGKGGSAIWSTDDSSVFISTPEGIERVDVNAHTATLVLSAFKAPDLRFYRDGYLYFIASANASASMSLNRVNLATMEVTPVTEKYCQFSYDFWLDISGALVYYRCKADPAALYTVGSDGIGSRMLRTNVGRIIGYNNIGEPLTLLKVATTFQVVKLVGNDAYYDQTIVADVAPGASDLSVDNVAVAPYGFSLLALAHYPNGVGKIWYDDLVLHKQIPISTLSDARRVSSLQVGGWSRLQVPASSHFLGQ